MSRARPLISSFAAGTIFALGLALGGMTQPAKVLAFLDVTGGAWDPSLALVMGGAILVHAPLYQLLARRRTAPALSPRFELPGQAPLTLPLIAGAAIFGVGWGLGGFCPGPALASVPTLSTEALTFVAAMTFGMLLNDGVSRRVRAHGGSTGAHVAPSRSATAHTAPSSTHLREDES